MFAMEDNPSLPSTSSSPQEAPVVSSLVCDSVFTMEDNFLLPSNSLPQEVPENTKKQNGKRKSAKSSKGKAKMKKEFDLGDGINMFGESSFECSSVSVMNDNFLLPSISTFQQEFPEYTKKQAAISKSSKGKGKMKKEDTPLQPIQQLNRSMINTNQHFLLPSTSYQQDVYLPSTSSHQQDVFIPSISTYQQVTENTRKSTANSKSSKGKAEKKKEDTSIEWFCNMLNMEDTLAFPSTSPQEVPDNKIQQTAKPKSSKGNTRKKKEDNTPEDPYERVKRSKNKKLIGLPLEKAEQLRLKFNEQERNRQRAKREKLKKLKQMGIPNDNHVHINGVSEHLQQQTQLHQQQLQKLDVMQQEEAKYQLEQQQFKQEILLHQQQTMQQQQLLQQPTTHVQLQNDIHQPQLLNKQQQMILELPQVQPETQHVQHDLQQQQKQLDLQQQEPQLMQKQETQSDTHQHQVAEDTYDLEQPIYCLGDELQLQHNQLQQSPHQSHNQLQQSPLQSHNQLQQSPLQSHNQLQQSPLQSHNQLQQSPLQSHNQLKQSPHQSHNQLQQSPHQSQKTHSDQQNSTSQLQHTQYQQQHQLPNRIYQPLQQYIVPQFYPQQPEVLPALLHHQDPLLNRWPVNHPLGVSSHPSYNLAPAINPNGFPNSMHPALCPNWEVNDFAQPTPHYFPAPMSWAPKGHHSENVTVAPGINCTNECKGSKKKPSRKPRFTKTKASAPTTTASAITSTASATSSSPSVPGIHTGVNTNKRKRVAQNEHNNVMGEAGCPTFSSTFSALCLPAADQIASRSTPSDSGYSSRSISRESDMGVDYVNSKDQNSDTEKTDWLLDAASVDQFFKNLDK